MSNRGILLLIAAFLTLTIGSFVWFVASWDAGVAEPVSGLSPSATVAAGPDYSRIIGPRPTGAAA